MSYTGQIIRIPMGMGGLNSDDSQSSVPYNALIQANNVALRNGIVEKDYGSRRWNTTPLASGVVAAFDFWPTDVVQRFVVVTRDGTVTKYMDPLTPVTIATGLTITDPPILVAGGAESAGRNRKLFLFTGNNPVKVLSGDGTSMTSLAGPATDWASSYPTFGLIHRNRLCAFGNVNMPHQLYMSDPANHENFTSNNFNFTVFPGESEALFSGYVYKTRLFLGKYPEGVYYLNDSDPDFTNWSIQKLTGSFGAASRQCFIEAMNDLLIANSIGTVTSGQASSSLIGSLETGDVFRALRIERFARDNFNADGRRDRQAVWYGNKKLALFTYRSTGGIRNDRVLTLDFNAQSARPYVSDKDQANCLCLRKDTRRIQRPFYGSEDGYVYEMDREDRDVGGSAFTGTFQTPHEDFGFADPGMAGKNKLFDFLQVTFEETGNWDLNVDVYIDKEFVETIPFRLTKNEYLNNFTLNKDDVVGRSPQDFRMPLHGAGKRISFRCYNSGLRQNFKIVALTVYFRLGDEGQGTSYT